MSVYRISEFTVQVYHDIEICDHLLNVRRWLSKSRGLVEEKKLRTRNAKVSPVAEGWPIKRTYKRVGGSKV